MSKERADGNRYYNISKTYLGNSSTVAGGFVKGYVRYVLLSSFRLEGFLHTHPDPHKAGDPTSNADDFLMFLPGISKGYVYDVNGIGIYHDKYGSYGVDGVFYSNNANNFIDALQLLISNGHG